MKKFSFIAFSCLIFFSFIFHTSCELSIGMGDAPDLTAPEISITSPAPFANVGYNFTLQGTCKDNVRVTSIVITNNDTGYEYGKASITGETWSFDMHLSKEMEGEISLLATASDNAGNVSVKSYKQITLRIDETAPNALSWYIERGCKSQEPFDGNGIQTPLYDLSTLQTKNILLSENKDIPQNQSFAIHGTFYDAMSINEVSVYLKDTTGKEIIRKTYSAESSNPNYIGVGKSIFSPVFYFYESELIAKNSSYNSGKHYFQIGYVVKDDHGNTSSGDLNWMIWYPESDLPVIYQSQINIEENTLSVLIDSEIPIDIFDDDGLLDVYYALKEDTIYSAIPGSTLDEKCQSIIENTSSIRDTILNINTANSEVGGSSVGLGGKRDNPVSIKTPTAPKHMYLIICTRDKNSKWNSKIIDTTISDATASMLFISSPKNNEKPTMNAGNNTFTVTGYVLGKNPATSLKMVYIPGSESSEAKKTKAQAILNGTVSAQSGPIVKSLNIASAETYAQNHDLKQQNFSVNYDILTELSTVDSENETSYFFLFRLECANGSTQEQIYQLNKDIAKPALVIESPANMKAIDYEKDNLLMKFKASKESGLQITDYKISFNGNDYTNTAGLTQNGDYYQIEISKDNLKTISATNPQPVIKFWVKDALGIETEDERTVILTKLPTLNEITTEHPSGTYYITGKELLFQAKFSDNVRIIDMTDSNKPQIDIRYSNTDTTPKYATYKSGSGTNTLVFSYVVPENAESEGLIIKPLDNENTAIKLNGTSIKPVAAGEGSAYITTTSLLSGKTIKLDGVAPTISTFTLSGDGISNGGKKYHKVDNKLTITMTVSEPVHISGNPTAKMKIGTTDLSFSFNGINGETLSFVHTVSSLSVNGEVKNTQGSCFDNTNKAFIKDVNGNELKLSSVPDVDSGLIIDTTPPSKLTVVLLNSSNSADSRTSTFDYEPTLSISSGIESGCTVEYSLDKGVIWETYNSASKPTLSDGTYQIIARQTDIAGNVSPDSDVKNATVKATFPSVSALVVSTPDGKYKKDSVISFALSFSEKVKVPADSATLTFAGINKGDGTPSTVEKTASVTAEPDGTNTVIFKYSVKENDDLHGIKITGVSFTDAFVDEQNHKVPQSIRDAYAKGTLTPISRTNVILDSKAPGISTYTPENGETSTLANTKGTFKITLTFDEPVYKENGIITLQRRGQWGIPAVIDGVEFKKIYDLLGTDNQQNLIWTEQNGNISSDVKDAWTGISVGPYKKITHGIDLETGAPLTDTSFVLDFNLGLFDGTVTLNQHDAITAGTDSAYDITATTGKTFSVKNIRKALEAYGYHKYEIDISNNNLVKQSIDKKTLTIELNEDLPAGVEWELGIPNTALRDAAGNSFAGLQLSTWTENKDRDELTDKITDSSYKFWSKGVATPFVRVDRYSHGFGANVPSYDTETKVITMNTITKLSKKVGLESNIKMDIEPTGYVRVRVDSQTKGSTIDYGVWNKSSKSATATVDNSTVKNFTTNSEDFTSKRSYNEDATKTNLEGITLSETSKQNGIIFVVGDGNYLTSRKDYVRAIAKKSDISSDSGYEGVFKTVVYVTKGSKKGNHGDNEDEKNQFFSLNVEGGTFKGGQPSIDGFPFKDGVSDNEFSPYTKNMYKLDNNHNYIFNSYELVTNDVALLLTGPQHSQNYPYVSYGNMVNVLTCYYYWGDHQGD